MLLSLNPGNLKVQKLKKEFTEEAELAYLKMELQESKEKEQKRLQEKLHREDQKKQKEAAEIAQKELEKEVQRRMRKLTLGLPVAGSTTKRAISIPKQEFNGHNDWWKNPAKVQELYNTAPAQPAPAAAKQALEVVVVNRPAPVNPPAAALAAATERSGISIAAQMKPTEYAYRPLPALAGQPVVLSREDRDRLLTAQRMIKTGIEDLLTRAYGDKPSYDMLNPIHVTLVKHGFLYYFLRALEALHPTGRLLTKEDENFISLVNNFVGDARKLRELRHQTRNYPQLITLKTLAQFANLIKSGGLLQNIECLLNEKTFPKNPKPLQFGDIELCSLREKADWDKMDPKFKTVHLLQMIVNQFKHMKSYIKSIEGNRPQFEMEGEIQNVLKMSIAIIGKSLTVLHHECGFRHPAFYNLLFRTLVKQGIDISHKIGEDLEFCEFDEISPQIMFDIALNAHVFADQIESIKNTLLPRGRG